MIYDTHTDHSDGWLTAGVGGVGTFIWNMIASGQLLEAVVMGAGGAMGGLLVRELYKFLKVKLKKKDNNSNT